jgi:DUF2075 family protein
VVETPDAIEAELHRRYAADGFLSQYTTQTQSWSESIPELQRYLRELCTEIAESADWHVLLEMPLYRLRRRIDAIILTNSVVVVLELKVGATGFSSTDRRQVEEYALDLRDFHQPSESLPIVPALWSTKAKSMNRLVRLRSSGASKVQLVGTCDLSKFLHHVHANASDFEPFDHDAWIFGAYRPVPTVIEAATTLFAGHSVDEITRADASNLGSAARRIVEIVDDAKASNSRDLVFLTGVPGSGKTLAGLQVVHKAVETGVEDEGDIVYLSGNTPLVTVLREALARDEHRRRKSNGEQARMDDVRDMVRARIQHIMDFLREYLSDEHAEAPHEHAIVFDEAQRAWDAKYGSQKFDRTASEPSLLLEIMGRHDDWCVLVGLVGGGQEINTGENGVREWGDALRSLASEDAANWAVHGPSSIIQGDSSTAFLGLGDLPESVNFFPDNALKLEVPLRSYRSPCIADWVSAVIRGDAISASELAGELGPYPIQVTRSLTTARDWLRDQGRGERRYGLVASSGAQRLRAEGLGVSLNATEGINIAHWYLKEPGDIRSSFALEVTANEYTTQGLELDFVCLCWGGDFLYGADGWEHRQFRGCRWTRANGDRKRFIENSYRVLLTRAREGMVIWVPEGDSSDKTRTPSGLDMMASFLKACGATEL